MASTAFTSALWFLAILVTIPLALWLLKRSPAGARFSGMAAGGAMRQVSVLPISASQRILTVEVGQGDSRRWLVLGVTPQNISTLYTIAPHDGAAEVAPAAGVVTPSALATPPLQAMPAFAQLLARMRQDKGIARER
jgi:flagellar protein FliO/FliZ